MRLETNDDRHAPSPRWSSSATARRRRSPPTSSSSPAARPTRPSCCSRRRATSTRTGSPTAPTRSGATTCSTTAQAVLALSREENPTVFQKTLGLNDFYFGSDDFEFPLGNIQMVGKSQAPMFRGEKPGETKLAPEWTLERVARHAVDFWLSTEDLPRPENRVTRRPRRQAHARLHGDQRRGQEAAVRQAPVDARAARHATRAT